MGGAAIPRYMKQFQNASTTELIDQSRRVGREFLNQGRNNPKFFTSGKVAPAENAEELLQRYGVSVRPDDASGQLVFRHEASRKEYPAALFSGQDILDDGELVRWPGLESVRDFLEPEGKYYKVYSGTSEMGSGVGGSLYPAIWDTMYGLGEGYERFTDTLSGSNLVRGPLNELAAYVRHGDNARMIPNIQQYRYSTLQPRNVLLYGPEEQIGSRLLDFAARTQEQAPEGFKMVSPLIKSPQDFMDIARAIREVPTETLKHSYNKAIGPRAVKARGALELLLEGKPVPEFYWDSVGGLRAGGVVRRKRCA